MLLAIIHTLLSLWEHTLFIEGMLASSRGYPLFFLKKIMRSLTSTWINAEKTDLIFMPKGSTSKSATLCSCCTSANCGSWPSSEHFPTKRKHLFFFFFPQRRCSECLLFLKLLIWVFPILYGTLNLCWLCTGVGIWGFWVFFPVRLLSHSWEDKNWNAQLSWQKCVSFFRRPYNSYSQLHA